MLLLKGPDSEYFWLCRPHATVSVTALNSARVAQKWPQATHRQASLTAFQGNDLQNQVAASVVENMVIRILKQ